MVRLRRMEIPGWRAGYAEWKSQVACSGYVKWRSPARQLAATGSALDVGSEQPPRVRFGKSRSSSGTYAWWLPQPRPLQRGPPWQLGEQAGEVVPVLACSARPDPSGALASGLSRRLGL